MNPHHQASAIQAVIDHAMGNADANEKAGFIVVKWKDRYSHYATTIPDASLEEIVQASTLAQIIARFRLTDIGWVELTL